MFLQGLRVETGRVQHNGVVLAQEVLVTCIEIVFPQMATEPRRAHRPETRLGTVYRTCDAPLVCVVVQHPAFHAIHIASRLLALFVYLADELEQGFVQLCQVGDLRGPVVHLEVDVRGVFRVPRREHLVVPKTLQVGRIHVVRL